MPKLLKKEEFEKVILELWNRVKNKFIEDVTFDTTIDAVTNKPKNTLNKTKNGQSTEVVNHVVTKWMDLDYTTQSDIKNIFDKNTQVEEDQAYSFSNIVQNTGCRIIKIPCNAGDEFTIVKNAVQDSKQVGVYNANGGHIRHLEANHQTVNGKVVYRFTIPIGLQDASYFVNSMYKDHTNINEVMVFKGNVPNSDIPTNYVPFTDGATVLIDSSEVALSFDITGTSLSSATIHSAIKELDKKAVKSVNNVKPVDGNVDVNAGHIEYDDAQTHLNVQNVQDAIEKLKEDMGLLDTSDIHIVQDNNELNNLLQTPNKVKHGDLIYIINSDSVVDFTDTPVGSLNDPIAMIYDDTLGTGNNLRVFSRFSSSINISANIVSYEDNTTNLGANNVQQAIEKLKEKVDDSVTSVKYDPNVKKLKYVKNNTETEITNIITEWQDLEHVEQYHYANLMEYNKKVTGYYYGGSGDSWVANSDWSTYFLDVKDNEVYTIFRKNDDSSRFIYTDSIGGVKIDATSPITTYNSNGFIGKSLTIPSNRGITKLAIQFQHGQNGIDDIIVFSGDIRTFDKFTPFADGNLIQIGTEVSHKFDNSNSSLLSTTIESAIKELDGRVLLSNTSLSNKVDRSEVGTGANQIPQLDQDGKLPSTIIPNIAITKIVDVTDTTDAVNKVSSGDIQIGDFVRVASEQNKIYIHNGVVAGDFNARFVEISAGGEAVKTINNQKPTNGNFEFGVVELASGLQIQVNGSSIMPINYATQQEINDLKNTLTF